MLRKGLLGALLLLAAGCKLGPNYKRPEVKTPDAWREMSATARMSRSRIVVR